MLVGRRRQQGVFHPAIGLLLLIVACGESDDVDTPTDPPAEVVAVSSRRGTIDYYFYGEELQLTFDSDPGNVEVVYYKSNLDVGVAGEGTTRAFLVLSSRGDFTWERGGALALEFEPLMSGQIQPPITKGPRFPSPGATGVSVEELMRRGVSFRVGPPFHPVGKLISPLRMSDATITASDGRSWHPQAVTELDRITLASDPENPFLGGQSYVVRIDIWLTYSPTDLSPIRIEFATE